MCRLLARDTARRGAEHPRRAGTEVMPVQAGQMECVTRAADEDTVSDLNVYLFDAYSRELVLHSYPNVYGAGI